MNQQSAFFWCLAVAGCAIACSPIAPSNNYYIRNIPCADHSLSGEWQESYMQMAEKYEGIEASISDKQYNHVFQSISSVSKNLADKGNAFGIGVYGVMIREKLIADYFSTSEEDPATSAMPDSIRNNMIIALSYI